MSAVLRGRDDVLAMVTRWLDGVGQGAGGAVHLEGAAGVGKTAIVEWTADQAQSQGRRVFRVVGHPEESAIPWGGLSQLVAPYLSQLSSFDEQPRNTLKRAMRLGVEGDVDEVSVGMAVLYMLTSSDESVVVLIDDAQWLDQATLSVLGFICRRLQSTGVGVLTAQHPGTGVHTSGRLVIEPLPVQSLRFMARDRGAASAVADVLAEQAQGLPVVLMHLLDALDGDQLRGHRPLPGNITEVGQVDVVVATRLRQLPPDTQRLMAAAALAPYRGIGSLAAELRLGDAAEVLDAAVRGAFVELDGDAVRFRHPTVRTAAVHTLSESARRDLHRLLAQGADAQHAAWHLAASAEGPDDTAAAALDALADDAELRGAALEALRARQSAIAVALTASSERLFAAARNAVAARLPEAASALLHDLDDGPVVEALRAEIAWIAGDVGEARRRWTELAHGDTPPAIAASSLRRAAMAAFRMYDTPGVLTLTRGSPEPDPHPKYITDDALLPVIDWGAASISGHEGAVERLVHHVQQVMPTAHDPDTVAVLAEVATLALARTGRSAELAALSTAVGDLASHLSPRSVPALLISRAAYRARSDLVGAVALARDAMALAEEWDLSEHRPFALAIAAISEATRGGPDAHELATSMRGYGLPVAVAVATYAEALVLYGQGAYGEALALLEPLHQAHPTERSFGFFWHHDMVDMAVRVGEHTLAQRVTEDLRSMLEITRSPWVEAAWMRCTGLVAEDRSEVERWLGGAIERFAAQGYAVTAARVHLDLGERLRRLRQRSSARHHIEAAQPALIAAGARPWVERCEQEASALGLAPAHAEASASVNLTPREIQVARWLVAGLSFKQIATRLFLSPRTVEAHGQTIYRKLGVKGRAELAQLASRDASLSPTER